MIRGSIEVSHFNINHRLDQHIDAISQLKQQAGLIEQISEKVTMTILNGHTVYLCGNGGSASDCLHIAAELVGRYSYERGGVPSIALTGNPAVLSSIANDYGYDQVFSRQIEALAKANDLLIALSTSGNSQNVLNAIKTANRIGVFTIGLTGDQGAEMEALADMTIKVPESNTAIIQEAHILIGHILCEQIDAAIYQKNNER